MFKLHNIVMQFCKVARTMGLQVFTNQASIADVKKNYSKYHLSKPDLVGFKPVFVANEVNSKWLLMCSDDDNSDLCDSFKNIVLDGEGKRPQLRHRQGPNWSTPC